MHDNINGLTHCALINGGKCIINTIYINNNKTLICIINIKNYIILQY